ncbi:MAG: glycosyltransferase [Saprospiraceae bacterium]|nr:glycosyltransferase [Saprospiraceae bacterium]
MQKVVELFSHRKDWELIISCGEIDINQIGRVATNIHLFQKVPQLSVIKLNEFVITHAGSNTVKECILLGKPMLTFPLNNKWDQNGIAARVVYHKMGLSGNINTITIKELSLMVNELIENPIYKENTLKMSKIFQKQNDNLELKLLELFNS